MSSEPEKLSVQIAGTRPLLMHSTAGLMKPKKNKVKSSKYDPEEDAKESLYLDSNGKICIPSFNILSAMKKAATGLKKPGAGKKTLKDFVFSGLTIDESTLELDNQKYEVDIRPVVVQRARILRARPLFKEWGVKFTISILDEQTWDVGMIRELLEDTGKFQGLMDFRPLFGTFKIVSMKRKDGKEIK